MSAQSIPLPQQYVEQMKSLLGEADFFLYENAMNRTPVRGLRINALKAPLEKALELIGEELCPVPWTEHGFYYEEALHPGQSPLHDAGLYYIQEPSAMSAATLLNPRPGEWVLDLCAAPGGKSTQIAASLMGEGLLVSNEPNPSRARVLSSNIERMGVRNAIVTCEMPERLAAVFPETFDRILVDAPCSGEGMFRKTPESRLEWHPGSVLKCSELQASILQAAAKMLKPGGTLVYSTCTHNKTENEENIERFLSKHTDFSLVPFSLPGLSESQGMLHLFPHEIRGEGHFLAKMERAPGEEHRTAIRGKREKPDLPPLYSINRDANLFSHGDKIWLCPQNFDPTCLAGLRWLRCGLALANRKGKLLEPDHAAGMALTPGEVTNSHAIDLEELRRYQAGEVLSGNPGRGFVVLFYEGIPVGLGKASDGVIKNHYPKGLRNMYSKPKKDV